MDIGIRYRKRNDIACILPKLTSYHAEETRAAKYNMIFHYDEDLPSYGVGDKKYFAYAVGYGCKPLSCFINADDRRSAKKSFKSLICESFTGQRLLNPTIYELKQ